MTSTIICKFQEKHDVWLFKSYYTWIDNIFIKTSERKSFVFSSNNLLKVFMHAVA